MSNLTLELNINSASNLVNVNFFTKMDVYAAVTIRDDMRKKQKVKTPVHRSGGSNPTWNHGFKFPINEGLARDGRLTLAMRLMSRRVLGNKEIGRVNVPLLELLNSITPSLNGNGYDHEMKSMTYQVRTRSGKRSGFLTFSYRFKPVSPVIINESSVDTAYHPPPSQVEHPASAPPELSIEFPKLPQPPCHLNHPFVAGSSNDPLPVSYGAVMTEETGQASNHTPNASPLMSHQGDGPYAYERLSPAGYEYGDSSYQQSKEIGLGLGMGAGLLGGLMMGDIVSDVANSFDL